MKDSLKQILTIPNALSLYRLSAAPLAAWLALEGHRTLFAVFICISLLTDLLDGIIARLFHQETQIGARLDAFADSMTLVVAVLGVYVFEFAAIQANAFWLYGFLAVLALGTVITLVRFRKLPAFHLYSFKVNDVILAIFFVTVFTYGFIKWLFIFAMVFASLASLEIVLVAVFIREFRTNQKGLYWVLKNEAD